MNKAAKAKRFTPSRSKGFTGFFGNTENQILNTKFENPKTLRELKQEAKALKIPGWNFYKDSEKLALKIKEFKG